MDWCCYHGIRLVTMGEPVIKAKFKLLFQKILNCFQLVLIKWNLLLCVVLMSGLVTARRGHQSPWNWGLRQLSHKLECPQLNSGRAVLPRSHRALSPALISLWWLLSFCHGRAGQEGPRQAPFILDFPYKLPGLTEINFFLFFSFLLKNTQTVIFCCGNIQWTKAGSVWWGLLVLS